MDRQDQLPVTPTSTPDQPTPPPVQPVAPAPIAPSPTSHTTRTWLIVGGVMLGLAIIAAIIYATVFYISKDDYQKAKTATNSAVDSYNDAGDDFQTLFTAAFSGYGTPAVVDDAWASLDDTYGAYKVKIQQLETLKAMRDGEVKAAYNKLKEKNATFEKFVDGLLSSTDALSSASKSCSSSAAEPLRSADYATIADSYDRVLGPCIKDLETLSDSPSEQIAEYARSMAALYKEQRAIFVELQSAYNAKDADRYRAAGTKLSEQSKKFNDTSSVKSLKNYADSVDVADEFKALLNVISKKAS